MDWVLILIIISGPSRASGFVTEKIETPYRFKTEALCREFVARQRPIPRQDGKSYILDCDVLRPERTSLSY
jgi:hypothetical protein